VALVLLDVLAHEFPDDLRSGLFVVAAGTQELIPKISVHPNPNAHVFSHGRASVSTGYTLA
jgi:hypothetical protein